MVTQRLCAALVVLVGVAGCDSEPALPPAWAIGVRHVDAAALGLVDAAHPGPVVPALASLTDQARLTIQTPDGSGQVANPDVIVDTASASTGQSRILLAATPFPYADVRAENPSVFATTDGVAYTVPTDAATNPAELPPDIGNNADPDLRFDPAVTGDAAQLFFLVYLVERPKTETVISVHTNELAAWPAGDPNPADHEAVLFNQDGGDDTVASPTTLIDPTGKTWLFLIDTTIHQVLSLTSSDGLSWDPATKQATALDFAGITAHKIDVVAGPTGSYAMLIAGQPAGATHDNVYAATSTDLQTWTLDPTPLLDATDPALGALTLGRASGVVSGASLWIWYALAYNPN